MEENDFQILSNLPNQRDKHIDYVIFYEKFTEIISDPKKVQIDKKRTEFFAQLIFEGFEIYNIEETIGEKKYIYALLHCSIGRLMKEAENMRLELRLKNCRITSEEADDDFEIIKFFKKKLKRRLKNDDEGYDIVSGQFESDISFMFQGYGEKNEIFDNRLRCLIVDNILINLTYKENNHDIVSTLDDEIKSTVYSNLKLDNCSKDFLEKIIKKSDNFNNTPKTFFRGLKYMLDNKYFDDAFILHEESSHYLQVKKFFKKYNNKNSEDKENSDLLHKIKVILESNKNDLRKNLHTKWAKLSNIFKFQPMWEIRNYFGESNAIYFAWLGIFISSLWLPMLIGFGFFTGSLIYNIKGAHFNTSLANSSLTSNFYSSTFTNSFDNDLMPIFALIICIWGALFMEIWKRENSRLAYEWDVDNFEFNEPDLPEYSRKKKLRAKLESPSNKIFWRYEKYLKYLVSFLILLLMVINSTNFKHTQYIS
ncbi:unnamed protein product [Brachionus calyciflorus]|uniref:Anoctamin n=1 Tax=Brachionus calyciflorus TaxID=104777 RepID=A0A814ACE3_9BILA|nr:unnamed protein product [Brachionus calyciflorus]